MSTQAYIDTKFKVESLALIDKLDRIITEYTNAGYRLTVRQLYYQCIARDILPDTWIDRAGTKNNVNNYKKLAGLISDAKLAGLLDWDAIEDRTREFIRRSRWDSAADIVRSARDSFHMDMWHEQPNRVFVIVEKEALAGVLERCCTKLDVPLLAARGYPSGTIVREFAIADVMRAADAGQDIKILHLGDHDPSGIDMTRDLRERIELFSENSPVELVRIALTMKQVREQRPPPNPAKTNDPRFQDYMHEHGDESWELDALTPEYLDKLVTRHVEEFIDSNKWEERRDEIEDKRSHIAKMCETFEKKGI